MDRSDFNVLIVEFCSDRSIPDHLEAFFNIQVVRSINASLEVVKEIPPDLIVYISGSDVSESLEACRQTRQLNAYLPIIFISGTDDSDALQASYEAGANEFLSESTEHPLLITKINALLKHKLERAELSQQSQEYLDAAMEAMTGSSELGVIILFLQNSYACRSYEDLGRALFEALTNYNLTASLMIDGKLERFFMSNDGVSRNLENSILESCQHDGRILAFNRRSIYNGNQCSFLIRNMPIEDEAKTGRLRDHLATILVGMDARIKGIDIEQALIEKQNTIRDVINDTRVTLNELNSKNKQQRIKHASVLNEVGKKIEGSFINLGLTEEQEDFMSQAIEEAEKASESLFDNASDLDTDFQNIIGKLTSTLEDDLENQDELVVPSDDSDHPDREANIDTTVMFF